MHNQFFCVVHCNDTLPIQTKCLGLRHYECAWSGTLHGKTSASDCRYDLNISSSGTVA
jgi:hypothetical protein